MKLCTTSLIITFVLFLSSNSNAEISNFCFIDDFGYISEVTATRTGPGYYTLTGSADVLTGYDWIVSGYYDKATDVWSLTYTNPTPDACLLTTDYFTYTSTSHSPGVINFNWESYCFGSLTGSGAASTIFLKGLCVFRLAESEQSGPSSPNPALSGLTQRSSIPSETTPVFKSLFMDDEFSVINSGTNNYTIAFDVAAQSNVKVDIYNYAGQFITTITESNLNEGFYKFNWNGTDASGNETKPGMYFATMTQNNERATYKFVK